MKWPGRRAEDCEEGFTWVGLDLWEGAWDQIWEKVGVETTAGKEGNQNKSETSLTRYRENEI